MTFLVLLELSVTFSTINNGTELFSEGEDQGELDGFSWNWGKKLGPGSLARLNVFPAPIQHIYETTG